MDNQSRVAIVREGLRHPDDGGEKVEYHLGDHLGSSSVVIGGNDEKASNFINREEFYPYGETSFGSFGRKRYRFTGKERDEESRLYYHGARYYAPWLARWTGPDPLGLTDHLNLYAYVKNGPLRYLDPTGMEAGAAQDRNAQQTAFGQTHPAVSIDIDALIKEKPKVVAQILRDTLVVTSREEISRMAVERTPSGQPSLVPYYESGRTVTIEFSGASSSPAAPFHCTDFLYNAAQKVGLNPPHGKLTGAAQPG